MFFVVTNWFEDSQYRTGQPRQDSWDRTAETGQLGQDNLNRTSQGRIRERTAGTGQWHRIAGTEQLGQDSRLRTVRTGQSGEKKDWTAGIEEMGTRMLEKDNSDGTARTGHPGQDGLTSQPKQGRLDRSAKTCQPRQDVQRLLDIPLLSFIQIL
jgi:hypothetical protein